jgi:hypothetical protein
VPDVGGTREQRDTEEIGAAPPTVTPVGGAGLGVPQLAPTTRGRGRDGYFPRQTRAVFVLVAVVVSVVSVGSIVAITVTRHGSASPPAATVHPAAAVAPTALGHGSLLLRANLSAALGAIRAQAQDGSPALVRVDAARVDVQVRTPGGRLLDIAQPWNGPATVISSHAAGGGSTALRWSQVDTAAPRRIAAALGSHPLSYVALLDGIPGWTAVSTDGINYTASLTGRDVKRAEG